jgi:hypothetical protein
MTTSEVPSKSITLNDLLEFVLANKGKYVYVGYNDIQIYNDLRMSYLENLLLIDTDDDGNICGMVCAKYTDTYKVLHIKQLICTNRKSFPYFIRKFNERFPDWRLTAKRSKKVFKLNQVNYNTTKLIRKVLYYG